MPRPTPTTANSYSAVNDDRKLSNSTMLHFAFPSSAKLAFLAVLALLSLNLNASSIALRSSPSSSSLRKRPMELRRRQTRRRVEELEDYALDSSDSEDDRAGSRADRSVLGSEGSIGPSNLEEEDGWDATEIENEDVVSYTYNDKELRLSMSKLRRKVKNKGKIAWLMSFPNSGTSFTSLLVRHVTNSTTATNYGMESHLGLDGKSVPVYDWSMEGPYWLHPPHKMETGSSIDMKDSNKKERTDRYKSGTKLGKIGAYDIPPASGSILTKTHCGSRCAFCPPSRYLETSASFLNHCLSGSRKVMTSPMKSIRNHDSKGGVRKQEVYEKQYFTYHPALVERAIHLIRDPFDNLVSRFHHEQKEHRKKNQTKWMQRYPNDVSGFKWWCADEDELYSAEENAVDWAARGYPSDFTRHYVGVSCHGELLRYVQWHVMAIRAVHALDVPVLRVYYEDYSNDLEGAAGRMLDFLGLDRHSQDLPQFDSDKDYSAYFTQEERAIASNFMRSAAGDLGRELLERYWVELDFKKLAKQTNSIKY
eukprot:CAMPEP_0172529608 /NCGR_PEP_ID=MMETSP1067-20121228/3649_1 /TAXON_ID=265564 ORGANISM="Thalassiosira punctigera, Strain Tpunct2005C2" /NCGR_SAMPLE_ID=MMETSP1067 /ASSEMBLY_ACC=CAM_ASM_000444 /LENGTH=534 /DNA_ID=CAMNT_0013313697 /DNA_START=45 /DNA_END=1649 /DNA_ORIENTATION=+